jgi:hypothetical protein
VKTPGRGIAVRIAVLPVLVVATVVMTSLPASAHNASGPRPTNYLSRIGSVTPAIPGVTIRLVELGNKLELTNRTGGDVTVLGYNGEPYLRVGPRGLYENLRSSATYINRTRAGSTPVPAIALGTGASTPPRWHRVSNSRTAIWHDHRVHWMGSSPPPEVQDNPGVVHTIDPRWTVAFRDGTRTVVVHGSLVWIPGPSGWPWVLFAAALFAVGFFVARRHGRGAIAAILALVGIDMAHTIMAEVARAGTQLTKTVQYFGDNFVSVIVWVAAAITIWCLWRRRIEALYGMLLVGAMVALVSGVTDLSYLWKSQLPTVGPHLFARAAVATALGLGFGVAAGALYALLRTTPRAPARTAHDPRWLERLVAGLDDAELVVECARLDAAEVIPLALSDAAGRLAPIGPELGSDALVFVVLAQDEVGSHVWSITAAAIGSGGLRVQRGLPAPARAELRVTFPAFLSLLAGTLGVEAAISSGRLVTDGDPALLALVGPRLGPAAGDVDSLRSISSLSGDA